MDNREQSLAAKLFSQKYYKIVENTIRYSIPKVLEADYEDLIQEVYLDIVSKEEKVESTPKY